MCSLAKINAKHVVKAIIPISKRVTIAMPTATYTVFS